MHLEWNYRITYSREIFLYINCSYIEFIPNFFLENSIFIEYAYIHSPTFSKKYYIFRSEYKFIN